MCLPEEEKVEKLTGERSVSSNDGEDTWQVIRHRTRTGPMCRRVGEIKLQSH